MPCIQTKVDCKISAQQEKTVKERLGKAISLLPRKSESWLMLSFEDECDLYFKGEKKSGTAFVEVKIFGGADGASYNRLTAEITKILHEELNVDPARCYVKYEEAEHWGWNGRNF